MAVADGDRGLLAVQPLKAAMDRDLLDGEGAVVGGGGHRGVADGQLGGDTGQEIAQQFGMAGGVDAGSRLDQPGQVEAGDGGVEGNVADARHFDAVLVHHGKTAQGQRARPRPPSGRLFGEVGVHPERGQLQAGGVLLRYRPDRSEAGIEVDEGIEGRQPVAGEMLGADGDIAIGLAVRGQDSDSSGKGGPDLPGAVGLWGQHQLDHPRLERTAVVAVDGQRWQVDVEMVARGRHQGPSRPVPAGLGACRRQPLPEADVEGVGKGGCRLGGHRRRLRPGSAGCCQPNHQHRRCAAANP